jgi:DNA adenine methylase
MPVTKSPLRYPGGKTQLTNFVEHLLSSNDIKGAIYCEPFSGGAGVAIELLLAKKVNGIILNDYDIGIYSIWKAILDDTEEFIRLIQNTPITIAEWHKQKEIHSDKRFDKTYSLELAFATYFLNRTNRSGIVLGGPIGGYSQEAKDKIDCRFIKAKLISKIQAIADRKDTIQLYNLDASVLIEDVLKKQNNENLFTFFDPPYYKQGQSLYTNFFVDHDHEFLANNIKSMEDYYWITTYDYHQRIAEIYQGVTQKEYYLRYSANRVRKEKEYLFHNEKTKVESWDKVVFEETTES